MHYAEDAGEVKCVLFAAQYRQLFIHITIWKCLFSHQQCVPYVATVIHQVQEFTAILLSAHLLPFTKYLCNLDFVWMIMKILFENLANAATLQTKCQSLPPSWPVGTSQYGVSYPLHIVRCMSRTWTSMWLTALHWSLLTPFPNSQKQSTAARSITSLKLLPETTLYSCNRLSYDNSIDQRSTSTKLNTRWWPVRKGRAAGTVVWNLKSCQVFLNPQLVKKKKRSIYTLVIVTI